MGLSWAWTVRLRELHSLLRLLCVFSIRGIFFSLKASIRALDLNISGHLSGRDDCQF
jgi:hypothetical protein